MPAFDLRAALLAEHSRAQCDRIVAWVGDDAARFARLMAIFLGDTYRLIQRAAWPVSYCVRAHPALVKPYLKKMLDSAASADLPPAVRRNVLRLLQDLTIPKSLQGRVMDLCFRYINDPAEKAAVKAFALTVLGNLAKDFPDIFPEIRTVIEARWEEETSAFRSRARRLLGEKSAG